MRRLPKKILLVTLLATGALVLSGCGDDDEAGPATGSSPETEAQATTENPQIPYAPGGRLVDVLEVAAPNLLVVTPADDRDPMMNQQFTVRVIDIDVPAQGECGYQEAIAGAEYYLDDTGWFSESREGLLFYDEPDDDPETAEVEMITDQGLHQAGFSGYANVPPFSLSLVQLGYAVPNDEREHSSLFERYNEEAKEEGRGLYGLCEGY